MLQALPRLTPDPRWKEQTKQRLLLAYDARYGRMSVLRHWALYVSSRNDPTEVANAIVARGRSWRPVAVTPERVSEAMQAIRPTLVVVDGRLPDSRHLLEQVKVSAGVTAITEDELLHRAA